MMGAERKGSKFQGYTLGVDRTGNFGQTQTVQQKIVILLSHRTRDPHALSFAPAPAAVSHVTNSWSLIGSGCFSVLCQWLLVVRMTPALNFTPAAAAVYHVTNSWSLNALSNITTASVCHGGECMFFL